MLSTNDVMYVRDEHSTPKWQWQWRYRPIVGFFYGSRTAPNGSGSRVAPQQHHTKWTTSMEVERELFFRSRKVPARRNCKRMDIESSFGDLATDTIRVDKMIRDGRELPHHGHRFSGRPLMWGDLQKLVEACSL